MTLRHERTSRPVRSYEEPSFTVVGKIGELTEGAAWPKKDAVHEQSNKGAAAKTKRKAAGTAKKTAKKKAAKKKAAKKR